MGLLDFRGKERFSSYHRKGLFSRVFYCAITVQLLKKVALVAESDTKYIFAKSMIYVIKMMF